MRRLLILAVLGLLVPLSMASVAAAQDPLEVRSAVAYPDRELLRIAVRCGASRAHCAGVLRTSAFEGAALTRDLRVHLVPSRLRRLTLRLRPGGLEAMGEGAEKEIDVTLTGRVRPVVAGSAKLTASVTCRTGSTVAVSARVRAFRLAGFGVYGCLRPAGRPMLLAAEDDSIAPVGVSRVATAGRFVALATAFSWKCSESWVAVYDLRARRTVHRRQSGTTVESTANGCIGTTAIETIVLRPSGAVAWTEAAGDAGAAAVRAMDGGRDRTLDAAPGVDPDSLRRDDADTVSWMDGSRRRTAALR